MEVKQRVVCDGCGAENIIETIFTPEESGLEYCPVCGSTDVLLDEIQEDEI